VRHQRDQETAVLQAVTVLPPLTGLEVLQPIAGPAAVLHPHTAVQVIRPVHRTAREATGQAAIPVDLHHRIRPEAAGAAAAVHTAAAADPAAAAVIQVVLHLAQAAIQEAAAVQAEEGNYIS